MRGRYCTCINSILEYKKKASLHRVQNHVGRAMVICNLQVMGLISNLGPVSRKPRNFTAIFWCHNSLSVVFQERGGFKSSNFTDKQLAISQMAFRDFRETGPWPEFFSFLV